MKYPKYTNPHKAATFHLSECGLLTEVCLYSQGQHFKFRDFLPLTKLIFKLKDPDQGSVHMDNQM